MMPLLYRCFPILARACAWLRAILLAACIRFRLPEPPAARGFRVRTSPAPIRRTRAKPPWVRREVWRLQALMPGTGCRHVGDVFNRLHAARHGMTVSKTWVNDTVRTHRHEIEELRRQWKHRVPRSISRNLIWGIDLTGKGDVSGEVHSILGIVDHGTRRAIALAALRDKSSITLLRGLLDAIEACGKPRFVRTDNESIFTSRLFAFGLWFLGIRHQRTDPGCPWMNGRVERFFGTLKEKLDGIEVASRRALADGLDEFAFWYNRVRPHRHLLGHTPMEAWDGFDPYVQAPKQVQFFTAWEGLLTGFYLRR